MNRIKTILGSVLCAAALFSMNSAKAESTIYLFDNYKYVNDTKVQFNGQDLNLPERPFYKNFYNLKEYKKSITKVTIPEDGRILIARDFMWANKPYHDEMTLDLNDGDVYYIELVAGMKSTLKIIKEKDAQKYLKKVSENKDWYCNPDIVFGK